jgi:hypothetical protein
VRGPAALRVGIGLLGLLAVVAARPTGAQAPQLRLYGVVLGADGGGVAYMADPQTGRVRAFRVGDAVGDRRLVRIEADRVVVEDGGDRAEVRLAGGPPAGPATGQGTGPPGRPAGGAVGEETPPPAAASPLCPPFCPRGAPGAPAGEPSTAPPALPCPPFCPIPAPPPAQTDPAAAPVQPTPSASPFPCPPFCPRAEP